MYVPRHYREERVEVMHDLIRRSSLATLVTLGSEDLIANHIPVFLDDSSGPFGALRCHVSRANAQWSGSRQDVKALAIFHGPSGYVTPSWYPTKAETGRVVPTYDFAVVHAYGPLVVHDDPDWLSAHVRELTRHHENPFAEQWSVDDAPADFIKAQIKGIVGIEIPIERLEGKWKVSQNRPLADREGVVEGLRQMSDASAEELARLIPLD